MLGDELVHTSQHVRLEADANERALPVSTGPRFFCVNTVIDFMETVLAQ